MIPLSGNEHYVTILSIASVFYPPGFPAVVQSFSHLKSNLCKWCEVSSPVCKDSICFSNCTLSSFCNVIDEICIAIWLDSRYVI